MHHIKGGKFHNSDNNIVSNEVINIKSLNQEISNFFLFKKLIFHIYSSYYQLIFHPIY